MQLDLKPFSIEAIVKAWNDSSLKVNEDYQRGSEWTLKQKQAFIDSLFRLYPLPILFLHEIQSQGLGGISTRYEIVDGQQRIRALAEYHKGIFPLLKPDDRALHLPNSLRKEPAPWGGFAFANLPAALQELFLSAKINSYIIKEVLNEDEIRDLFIRLQSGTALTRQQVRDAWPGQIGPFIEKLAGKLKRQPSIDFFRLADQRGQGADDGVDVFEQDRQFCAQLLCLFLARKKDPGALQGVTSTDLDQLYHNNTEFDTKGQSALEFEDILKHCLVVGTVASEVKVSGGKKKKYRKAVLFACFQLIQDLVESKNFKFNGEAYKVLAGHLVNPPLPGGKIVSGTAIASYFAEWRNSLPILGPRLDARRVFDRDETEQMLKKQGDRCAICSQQAVIDDCEGDHHPIPFALGGPTSIENGRAVHKQCHLRGAAALWEYRYGKQLSSTV